MPRPDTPQFNRDIEFTAEKLPFQGKRVWIPGGTNGTGLVIAHELFRLGADEVVIGGRNPDKLAATIKLLDEHRKSPNQTIITMPGDLGNLDQLRHNMTTLINEGHVPNVIVAAAAGGIDVLQRPLLKELALLRKRETTIEESREKLAAIVRNPQNLETSRRINFESYKTMLEMLRPVLPEGSMIIVLPSTLSAKRREIPQGNNIFYELVMEGKGELEDWVDEQTQEWASEGKYFVKLASHILPESLIGELIDQRMVPLLPKEHQEQFRAWYTSLYTTVDVAKQVIRSDPKTWPRYPLEKYIIGSGIPGEKRDQVLDELPISHPIFKTHLPL